MKQDKRQNKTTQPVKCRFSQKFRCPTPSFSTTAAVAGQVVSAATCDDAVTRQVSQEDLDFLPSAPSKEGSQPRSPLSPPSVVTDMHHVDLIMTCAASDVMGLSERHLSDVETCTIRSVSEASLAHGMQQQQQYQRSLSSSSSSSSSSSGFLKRRARSMCLTELASPPPGPTEANSFVPNTANQHHHHQQQQQQHQPDPRSSLACELPPSPGRSAAVGAWGLFVDLDEYQQIPLLVDRNRRRPLRFRRRAPLKGFVLPDIDETTSQLGNLSF